jgi:hypothetical protein
MGGGSLSNSRFIHALYVLSVGMRFRGKILATLLAFCEPELDLHPRARVVPGLRVFGGGDIQDSKGRSYGIRWCVDTVRVSTVR